MKLLLKIILDMAVVLYIGFSLLFVAAFCMLFWDIPISSGLCYLLATATIISWSLLFLTTVSDFFLHDWSDAKQKEFWIAIFKWGFFVRGLGLGVIVYYRNVVRLRLNGTRSMPGKKHHPPCLLLEAGNKLGKNLFTILLACGVFIVLGFFFKSDLLFLGSMKVAAVIFFAYVVTGMPFELIMLDHLSALKWKECDFGEYLHGSSGIYEYYENVYKKNHHQS